VKSETGIDQIASAVLKSTQSLTTGGRPGTQLTSINAISKEHAWAD